MSRTRKGKLNPVVDRIGSEGVAGPAFSHLIMTWVRRDGAEARHDPLVFAAAVASSLEAPLRAFSRRCIERAEREERNRDRSPSPRQRLADLLGMTRQSVEARLGFTEPPGYRRYGPEYRPS